MSVGLKENPLGSATIALIVGGVALLGWLIFARRSPIAPPPPQPELPRVQLPSSLLGPYAALW